jgi:opacity protein-like surface antigen
MPRPFVGVLGRAAFGPLALALLVCTLPRTSHAVEIVPSVGISRAPDGGENQTMLGLAIRQGFLPRTKMELQVSHRSTTMDFAGQSVDVRTIPITASVWFSPVPMVYAGGGLGTYIQAVEYQGGLYPTSNDTNVGIHLGGGLHFPLAPIAALDIQGRYVFLDKQKTALANGEFDPSFMQLSAGLAIGF